MPGVQCLAMRLLSLAFFLLASASCFASTAQMDGNDMLRKCKPFFDDIAGTPNTSTTFTEKLDSTYCAGYIAGVLDVEAVWRKLEGESSKATHYCLPADGIPNDQVLRILKKWLDNNPEKLHWRTDLIIHTALVKAFPCKD
jgi:hypothetical protein